MQDYMYSIIGVIALIIHIIINPSLFEKDSSSSAKSKAYRFLMLSIFAYYITDAGWGFFAGLNNIPALFLDTTIYYVAMASAIVCWAIYINEYLELKDNLGKALKLICWIYFVGEITALIINFFYPCFFWFDENDAYQAGIVRYTCLWIQVGLFFLTVIITGWKTIHASGIIRKRHLAITLFSIVMLFASFFQVLYPLLPVYAMGCLVGSCVLHVYIVEDEREEYRKIIAKEKALAEEASNAKTTFLFNMSHDIRTPMNAILGYTDIAVKHRDNQERVDECLAKIRVAGGHLLSLINDILEMSRIESGTLELCNAPVNIHRLIECISEMGESLAIPKSIDLKIKIEDISAPFIYADELHWNEVIINLVSNAIKYTPAGGKVTFITKQIDKVKNGKATYRFEVTDNGIGMSEEFQTHLFEAFSRERTSTVSKQEGAGLGLSIVKRLVDLAGGTISVKSKTGQGSTFTVDVPFEVMDEEAIRKYEEENQPVRAVDEAFLLENKKVLLVEDNEMNREIATEILKEAGRLIVDTAEDGEFAIKAVKEKGVDYYDFILMDIQMPIMNGYQATKAIRDLPNGDRATIIALSANAFEEDVQKSLASGMNAHVAKPIDVKTLLETLQKLAREK